MGTVTASVSTLDTPATKQLSDGNGNGTILGQSATDLIGFYGLAQGVAQPSSAGNVHTPTTGSTTAVYVNTTFDGSIGSTAYTVGDIVAALKTLGLIKS